MILVLWHLLSSKNGWQMKRCSLRGLPKWHKDKEFACQCRRCKRPCVIPGFGRFPGEGNGRPLQYSCLGNSTGIGSWWATVHAVAKSQTQLNDWAHKICDIIIIEIFIKNCRNMWKNTHSVLLLFICSNTDNS